MTHSIAHAQTWGQALSPIQQPGSPTVVLLAGQARVLAEARLDQPSSLAWFYTGPEGLDLIVCMGSGGVNTTYTYKSLDGSQGCIYADFLRVSVRSPADIPSSTAMQIMGFAGIHTAPLPVLGIPLSTTLPAGGNIPARWRSWVNVHATGAVTIATGRPPVLYATLAAGQNVRIDKCLAALALTGPCTVIEGP